MPHNSNYDPATGRYHADPNWKRYDPKYNPPPAIGQAFKKLKGLFASSPEVPEVEETASYPPLPPRPSLGAPPSVVPPPGAGRSTYGDIPGGGMRAVEGLQSALGTGLEAKAPYIRPGALSPQAAVNVFKASQPTPVERFVPGKMELARLAARRDVPVEGGGLEYGVTPGSSEMWGGELAKLLATEQFATPEAQAARQMEMYKIGGPERAAGVAGRADIEQQREASRGALAVAESKGQQAQNFLDMMNQARTSGANVSRLSAPGMGSVSFAQPKPVPTGLLTQATAAYNNYVAAKRDAWFGMEPVEELAVYKSTLGQALGMDTSIPDKAKPDLMEVMTDPELMELPISELQKRLFSDLPGTPANELDSYLFSDYAYDPNAQAAIINAIIKIRGGR